MVWLFFLCQLYFVKDVIKETIRDDDFIIRMGGDEFLIVFDLVNKVEAEEVWSRIVKKFDVINAEKVRPYNISVSHGIVELDEWLGCDIDDIIKIADELMYEEKRKFKAALKEEEDKG